MTSRNSTQTLRQQRGSRSRDAQRLSARRADTVQVPHLLGTLPGPLDDSGTLRVSRAALPRPQAKARAQVQWFLQASLPRRLLLRAQMKGRVETGPDHHKLRDPHGTKLSPVSERASSDWGHDPRSHRLPDAAPLPPT